MFQWSTEVVGGKESLGAGWDLQLARSDGQDGDSGAPSDPVSAPFHL